MDANETKTKNGTASISSPSTAAKPLSSITANSSLSFDVIRVESNKSSESGVTSSKVSKNLFYSEIYVSLKEYIYDNYYLLLKSNSILCLVLY